MLAAVVATLIALSAPPATAPWKHCDVTKFGAKGDNRTFDTAAIAAAVAACTGGGEVRLPSPGVYLTAPFNLTSNQVLHVESGATLIASQVLGDYKVQPSFPCYGGSRDSAGAFNSTCRYSAVVGGVGASNVSLTGGGTLDGSGWMFWALEAKMGPLAAACKKKWTAACRSPPLSLVEFEHSSRISMTRLVLRNSPFWTSHFIYSTDIFVKDVEIYAPFTQGNTDGVNPDSSSNVHIENLYVANGDDGVAIKFGLNEAGITYNRPTVNVTIRNMTTPKGCRGGIAMGSEMSGGVRDVRIENVALNGQRGIHMKTTKGRGGFIENITIINYTGSPVQLWDSYGSTNASGPWAYIGNFTLRNVKAGCSLGCGKMPADYCFPKTFDVGPHSCGHHGPPAPPPPPSPTLAMAKCVAGSPAQQWRSLSAGNATTTGFFSNYGTEHGFDVVLNGGKCRKCAPGTAVRTFGLHNAIVQPSICHNSNLRFVRTGSAQLQNSFHKLCLSSSGAGAPPVLDTCATGKRGQQWLTAGGVLQSDGLCLTAVAAVSQPGSASPKLIKSDDDVYMLTPDVVDAALTTMARRVGRLTKDEQPVITMEHPWEKPGPHGGAIYLCGQSVIEVGSELYLYYTIRVASMNGGSLPPGEILCLAKSADSGKTWTKPSLGLVVFNNSKTNNIVLANETNGGNVFVDDNPHVPAAERYKFISTYEAPLELFISPDGVHWSKKGVLAGVWTRAGDTQPSMMWDGRSSRYLMYGRVDAKAGGTSQPRECGAGTLNGKAIGLSAVRKVGFSQAANLSIAPAADPHHRGAWSNVSIALDVPPSSDGKLDCAADTYNSAAVMVHNAYIMMPSQFLHGGAPTFPYGPGGAGRPQDGVLDVRLAISGNASEPFSWLNDVFIERGIGELNTSARGGDWHYTGEWDAGYIFAARGFHSTATKTTVFFLGSQNTHANYHNVWSYNATSAIGRATMRKDGWWSFDAEGAGEKTLLTAPLRTPEGTRVSLNVNTMSSVRGSLRAEVLDASTMQPLVGLSLNESVPLMGNFVRRQMSWTSGAALPAGRSVRLRFVAHAAKLFTFELSSSSVALKTTDAHARGPWPLPESALVWTTMGSGMTAGVPGSMPLGNCRLGINVWADATNTVWLLLSHVDALDENTNLDKLGRVAVRATAADGGHYTGPRQSFRQEMHLTNATVRIDLPSGVSMDVWVDATTDAVRVASSSAAPHKLEATLEVWRNESGPINWCRGNSKVPGSPIPGATSPACVQGDLQGCRATGHPKITLHADIVKKVSDGIYFYHRNLEEWMTEDWQYNLKSQGMPTSDLPPPMANITFGGLLYGGSAASKMAHSAANPLQMVSEAAQTSHGLSIAGMAGHYHGGAEDFMADLKQAATTPASREAHSEEWNDFWSSSDLTVTAAASPADPAVAAHADRVTLMDKVTRAAMHSMAGGNISAIHSQAYGIWSAFRSPQEDYRIWGPCQWFQNIRLPYYHMLADGRFEEMKSLFNFYHRVLEVSVARTKTWFGIEGTFFPETMRQSGLYDSGEMGWRCNATQMYGPHVPGNPYIRYHREGGLEFSLLALDWLEHSQDLAYFQKVLLPQIILYIDYYANHFKDDANGRLDMFPAQALETWQCVTVPPKRSDCVTNPMPQVAGLHAVLPRLRALSPAAVPDAATRAKWAALAKRLPELPVGPCMQGPGKGSATCLLPGAQLPPKPANAENADLYAVHPYRVVSMHTNRSLGEATYANRLNKGESGWSEDLMDAALLGLVNESVKNAIARAVFPTACQGEAKFIKSCLRWVGFQGGIGTGGTATDHGSVGAAGLRYMLLHTGTTDEHGALSKKIFLFPSWPCSDWAVKFRLHAPKGTVVEGSYDGAGTLSGFKVTPPSRRADVVFAGCVKKTVLHTK